MIHQYLQSCIFATYYTILFLTLRRRACCKVRPRILAALSALAPPAGHCFPLELEDFVPSRVTRNGKRARLTFCISIGGFAFGMMSKRQKTFQPLGSRHVVIAIFPLARCMRTRARIMQIVFDHKKTGKRIHGMVDRLQSQKPAFAVRPPAETSVSPIPSLLGRSFAHLPHPVIVVRTRIRQNRPAFQHLHGFSAKPCPKDHSSNILAISGTPARKARPILGDKQWEVGVSPCPYYLICISRG